MIVFHRLFYTFRLNVEISINISGLLLVLHNIVTNLNNVTVLRVDLGFLASPNSQYKSQPHLPRVLPCSHSCHTWDLCEVASLNFHASMIAKIARINLMWLGTYDFETPCEPGPNQWPPTSSGHIMITYKDKCVLFIYFSHYTYFSKENNIQLSAR